MGISQKFPLEGTIAKFPPGAFQDEPCRIKKSSIVLPELVLYIVAYMRLLIDTRNSPPIRFADYVHVDFFCWGPVRVAHSGTQRQGFFSLSQENPQVQK